MNTQSSEPFSADRPLPPKGKISFEEFNEWTNNDAFAEWVDGTVIMLPPVHERHMQTVNFLRVLIGAFVEGNGGGRVLRMFLMRLHNIPSARLPDLLFVSNENAGRMKETYVDGPADLVVEVVSPESVSRDRGDKYAEYEQAGVREYWLIDPIRESANFYTLDDEGLYRDAPLEESHIFRSSVLAGLWLDVSWLWQEKLPTMRQTIELVDKMLAEIR